MKIRDQEITCEMCGHKKLYATYVGLFPEGSEYNNFVNVNRVQIKINKPVFHFRCKRCKYEFIKEII